MAVERRLELRDAGAVLRGHVAPSNGGAMRCHVRAYVVWGTMALGLASGCGLKMCVEGLEIGTTYRVTVLEPVSETSEYAIQTSQGPDFGTQIWDSPGCGTGFDFVSGSSFLVEPVSKVDLPGCFGLLAIPKDVDELQLLGESDSGVQGWGKLMRTPPFSVDRAGCTGWWELDFLSPRGAWPLSVPVPGEYPPVLLLRYFTATTTDGTVCGSTNATIKMYSVCTDYFVVQLAKT